jgi:hypothetical protein
MHEHVTLASAGNVLPAALASLRALGYVVTFTNNGRLCKAESAGCTLVAEDPLLLLGLVKLHEVRGNKWQPTDAEVQEYLLFDGKTAVECSGSQRADV